MFQREKEKVQSTNTKRRRPHPFCKCFWLAWLFVYIFLCTATNQSWPHQVCQYYTVCLVGSLSHFYSPVFQGCKKCNGNHTLVHKSRRRSYVPRHRWKLALLPITTPSSENNLSLPKGSNYGLQKENTPWALDSPFPNCYSTPSPLYFYFYPRMATPQVQTQTERDHPSSLILQLPMGFFQTILEAYIGPELKPQHLEERIS